MTETRAERRLAAVLAADLVGYSRLMGADEEGTFARLKSLRNELIDPTIAADRGRVFKTTGDGLLAEFASVVDAVRCGLKIQSAMLERGAAYSAEMRFQFRIGIHVGDVIFDDGDIFGDGVNIAARLESIGSPGFLCLSDDVYRQVRGKIDGDYLDLGPQVLKNIKEPMRAWRLSSELDSHGQKEKPPFSLPDKPSIAILPFRNMSSDPDQDFFADGIAEDIITALSRYPSLFVIGRNSSFSFKNRAVDTKQVGRELGVRYVLEGGLRKSGTRARVTAQLVECETGNPIWAERYDRELSDIFAVQDEIAEATTSNIAPAIAGAERQRAIRKQPANLDSWGAYQRGMWHLGKASSEDDVLAEKFFRKSIELDQLFAGGYIGLSAVLSRAKGTQAEEETAARQAVQLDNGNAEAHSRLALALLARGDHTAARAEAEIALEVCPNLADAHGARGVILAYSGEPAAGAESLRTCVRLDPRAPTLVNRLNQIALAHYFERAYDVAVAAAERVIGAFPDFPSPYRWRAAALGASGQTEAAKRALQVAIERFPDSFAFQVNQRPPWFRPEDHLHMLEGLRKAGWDG